MPGSEELPAWQVATAGGGATVQDLTYGYDLASNITAIGDNLNTNRCQTNPAAELTIDNRKLTPMRDWLHDFVDRHGSAITKPTGHRVVSGLDVPEDLAAVATVIRSYAFDKFVAASFRAQPSESPMLLVFPAIEVLCEDDFGNLIICDYLASIASRTATIVYLSHDPFAFAIVAKGMQEFLEGQFEQDMSYGPRRHWYGELIEEAVRRHDAAPGIGERSFANVGDGMRLFDFDCIARVAGPGITVKVSQ